MYVFPVSEDEKEFVSKNDGILTLKTYGLPYIFWIYAICSVALIFFMFMAIKDPILKLIQLGDDVDAMLGYSLLTFISLLPIGIFGFFFYEKRIVRNRDKLQLVHKVYGLKIFSEEFIIDNQSKIFIEAFKSSPNVARLNASEENVGFQNKGYFILWLHTSNGKRIQIDRHSRKVDLEQLKKLIETA